MATMTVDVNKFGFSILHVTFNLLSTPKALQYSTDMVVDTIEIDREENTNWFRDCWLAAINDPKGNYHFWYDDYVISFGYLKD